MSERRALLVGSLPFEDEADAMRRAAEVLGPYLSSLPDGEIGEKSDRYPLGHRAAWVQQAIDTCARDTANWDVVATATVDPDTGFPVDYQQGVRLRPLHKPPEMLEHLDFRYDEYFASSYPLFRALRDELDLPGLRFQLGVPTGLGIAFGMMKPFTAWRYSEVFNRRIALEVNRVLDQARDDVVVQIEIPAEVALAYRLPEMLHRFAVRSVIGLVERITPPARVGLHLCLGDLNNVALTQAPSVRPMVGLANRLIDAWPARHTLEYVHVPLAEGKRAPRTDPGYYAPLADLRLPEGTRFVAGFVHDRLTPGQLELIRTILDRLRHAPVDIACSCGLGRRDAAEATELMERTRSLVVDDDRGRPGT